MDITATTDGTTTTFALSGWLDTNSSPELSAELNNLDPNCDKLILDLAELEYISSAGLRVLVTAHKKMSGNLFVTHVSADVMQVLKMAGFHKRLNIS